MPKSSYYSDPKTVQGMLANAKYKLDHLGESFDEFDTQDNRVTDLKSSIYWLIKAIEKIEKELSWKRDIY